MNLPRGLHARLSRALDATETAVILEGGRAVGKTTLLRLLQTDGGLESITDLSDPAELRLATEDPRGFIHGLAPPCAIDEAQLLGTITLAVKAAVDSGHGPILLTGSTRISDTALGGSDPLAGRSTRLRLRPMTIGERKGTPVNAIPALFAGGWTPDDTLPDPATAGLANELLRGGLPRFPGERTEERATALAAYVSQAIQLSAGDTRMDRARIAEMFRLIAGSPSTLNLTRFAERTGTTRQSLAKYVERLEAAFLLDRLPRFSAGSLHSKQAAPRLLASDTALACWAGGIHAAARLESGDLLGPLLESLVINELLAQAEWAPGYSAWFWRDRDDIEVDLVLTNDEERAVCIEVKSSTRFRNDHANGIRAFRRRHPNAFHRAYVVYRGDRVIETDDGITALPITALWTPPPRPIRIMKDLGQLPDAPLAQPVPADTQAIFFVSYAHQDNDLDAGAIVRLARDIERTYQQKTGKPTLLAAIDRDLRWGDQWQGVLNERIGAARFLLAFVSPLFLNSTACRDEVDLFRSRQDGRLLLPIIWEHPRPDARPDPLRDELVGTQWEDWSEHRFLDPASGEYRREVHRLVHQLIERMEVVPPAPAPLSAPSTADDPDLFEAIDIAKLFATSVPELAAATDAVMLHLREIGSRTVSSNATVLRRQLRQVADGARDDVTRLSEANRISAVGLADLRHAVAPLIAGPGPLSDELRTQFAAIAAEMPNRLDLDEARTMTATLATFSKDLRPMADALGTALQIIIDLTNALHRWGTYST